MAQGFRSDLYENSIEDDFWEKVEKGDPDSCWLWTGAIASNGYGSFKGTTASRMSWIIHFGEIEDDRLVVCHKCDVEACVNPAHLFLGTESENMQDCRRKGRKVDTWIEKGGETGTHNT